MVEKYSEKYEAQIKKAAKKLFDLTAPTDSWEAVAAEVINKYMRPLFKELVILANQKDSSRENK